MDEVTVRKLIRRHRELERLEAFIREYAQIPLPPGVLDGHIARRDDLRKRMKQRG